jgi:beta-phosphoglucomutase
MIDFSSRAFIFDMDGTLVDNMQINADAWGKMLAENDVDVDIHEFLVKTAGKTNREIIPNFFKDATEEKLFELGQRKETIYRELFLPERRAIEGATEFLKEARNLGIKMAVATAAPVANMEFILDGLELRQYFQAITTAADVSHGKPSPEVFLKSAEKLGVETHNCLVFEDAFNGFEAAHRAGMRSVGIASVNSIEDIMNAPSVVEAHTDFSSLKPKDLIEKYFPLKAKAT